MKTSVILMDHLGFPQRLQTLRDAGADAHTTFGLDFTVPDEWLQTATETPIRNKHWFKCDAVAFAAIRKLDIKADFYWIIEYDVAASVDRWKKLFADTVTEGVDGVFLCPRTKVQTRWNPFWDHPGTDDRATVMHLQALYGISARALEWCVADAPSKRETFCEMSTGSTILANCGRITTINQNTTHCNNQTMKADPQRVLFNKHLINHPIKQDSYGVNLPKP